MPLPAILTDVLAVATNDHAVQIPVEEVTADYAILAIHHDVQAMSVRDKGSLWVMDPSGFDPDLQSETIYARRI